LAEELDLETETLVQVDLPLAVETALEWVVTADDVEQLPEELEALPVPELPLLLELETLQLLAFAKCIGVRPITNIAVMAIMAAVANNGDFCMLSQF